MAVGEPILVDDSSVPITDESNDKITTCVAVVCYYMEIMLASGAVSQLCVCQNAEL